MEKQPPFVRIVKWVIHALLANILVGSACAAVATVICAIVMLRFGDVLNGTGSNSEVMSAALQNIVSQGKNWGMPVVFGVYFLLTAMLIWRRVRYLILVSGILLCWGVVGYFAFDPSAPPPPDFGPVAAGDSETVRLYSWLVKDSPFSRLAELPSGQPEKSAFVHQKPEQYRVYVTENRTRIIRDWDADGVGRKWIETLAAFQPTEVIIPDRGSSPTVNFQAMRELECRHLAYAALLACDGRGDEAADLLTSLLRAKYALQRIDASLLGQMVPGIMLKVDYDVVSFVLNVAQPSIVVRNRLAETLALAPLMEQVASRIVLSDNFTLRFAMDQAIRGLAAQQASDDYLVLTLFGSSKRYLLTNPNNTVRTHLNYCHEIRSAFIVRNFEAMRAVHDDFVQSMKSRYVLKNPIGRSLLAMAALDLGKVAQRMWDLEDARLALLKDLALKPRANP